MAKKPQARTLQERRALHAERKFEEWLKKSVAASKAVQKWAAKVRYYRRTLARLDAERRKLTASGKIRKFDFDLEGDA